MIEVDWRFKPLLSDSQEDICDQQEQDDALLVSNKEKQNQSEDNLNNLIDHPKTTLCQNFYMHGHCDKAENCDFAHTVAEL